jgi:hypothetical protein
VSYILNPKHAGCEYPMIQASGGGFRHLLWYADTAYVSGQIGMVEPNEKALIGRSKSKMSEQSGTDWNQNNRNKDREKGVILSQSATLQSEDSTHHQSQPPQEA